VLPLRRDVEAGTVFGPPRDVGLNSPSRLPLHGPSVENPPDRGGTQPSALTFVIGI
jgi:hypothetical protein